MNGIIRLGTLPFRVIDRRESETQFVDTNKMVVVRTGFEPVSFKLSNPRPLKSVIASTIPPPDYFKTGVCVTSQRVAS